MSRTSRICSVLVLLLTALRLTAQDQILASERFDTYGANSFTTTATTAGGNVFAGGTGWKIGEGWFLQNVVGNGGSVADVSAGNHELQTAGIGSPITQDGFVGRQFSSSFSPSDSTPIWFSFKVWPQQLQAAGALVAVTHDAIEFHNLDYSSSTVSLTLNTAGSRTTTPANKVRWRIGGTDDPGTADKPADDTGYHLVVIKIAGTSATVWFDPALLGTPPATPFSTLTIGAITFDRILICGENSTTLHADEIRLGTSWASITDPSVPSVVSFTPSTSTTLGGAHVTISGANFGASPSVTFNNLAGIVTAHTASSIDVTTPNGISAGPVDLVVTSGSYDVVMPGAFTYVTPSSSFPGAMVQPSIAGTPRPGQGLTADPGQWTPTQTLFDFEWQSASDAAGTGAAAISGALNTNTSTSAYIVQPSDLGKWLRVQVTPHGANAGSAAFSALIAPISGKPTAQELAAFEAAGPRCGNGAALGMIALAALALLGRRRQR